MTSGSDDGSTAGETPADQAEEEMLPSAWGAVQPLHGTDHSGTEQGAGGDPELHDPELHDAAGVVDEGAEDPAPELVFASLPEFVEEFVAPMFGRDLEATRLHWCPQWWRHPEAVYRLESLWRSWEHLRQDAGMGSSTWISQHFDHHWPRLTGDAGPFVACTADNQHRAGRDRPLAVDPAPAGFMGVVEQYDA